jgi:hypothetical protein
MNQLTRGQRSRPHRLGDLLALVSGAKKNGHDAHYAVPVEVAVDDDARAEYERILGDQ